MSKPSKASLAAMALLLLFVQACGKKSARLQSGAVPPDKTLYENGIEYLRKSQFLKARLAFQTLINTYPDSEYAPQAYIGIADAWYKEGTREALLQAEAQYKDFMVFYPTHERAAEAQLKIAALNMRMMEEPDRDPTYARRAEAELKKFIEQFPDSYLIPEAKQQLKQVQEVLAKGIHLVGKFYYQKKSWNAAISRFEEVAQKYPNYSLIDEVYFELADALERKQQPEEAAKYYAKIATGFPFSGKFEEAKERLARLQKPIPEVDPVLAAKNEANRPKSEGIALFKPVKEFVGIFSAGRDPYEEAVKAAKLRLEAEKSGQAELARQAPTSQEQRTDQPTIETTIVKGPGREAVAETKITPRPEAGNANAGSNQNTTAAQGDNNKADGKNSGGKDEDKKKKKGLIRKIFR